MITNRRNKTLCAEQIAFSSEDRKKIWAAIDAGNHDAEIAMIYIYTGMRAAELLEIKKENVNLESRIILVDSKKTGSRRVPIHPCIMPFVQRLMQTDGEYLIMRYDNGTPTEVSPAYFREYRWKPLIKDLGMDRYSPHFGRNTCHEMLRKYGVDENLRILILGRVNVESADKFTNYPDAVLLQAIDKLPGR